MNIILLEENELFLPTQDERAKHIRKILHLGVGDSFRAGVINGEKGTATIITSDDEGIALSFVPEGDGSFLYPLTLIIAQVRPICMRRILRETVSMGVRKLILPVSDLGEKSYLGSSLYTEGEYRKILIDGAMQAGMTGVSEVVITESLEEAMDNAEGDVKILLDNREGALSLSSADLAGKSVVIAIGRWLIHEMRLCTDAPWKPYPQNGDCSCGWNATCTFPHGLCIRIPIGVCYALYCTGSRGNPRQRISCP